MIGKRGIIRVEHGKGGKERNVMLSAQLLAILGVYWKLAPSRIWLFLSRDAGTSIQNLFTCLRHGLTGPNTIHRFG